jgi:hypothetical protein
LRVRLLPVLGDGETGQERNGNGSAQHLNLFYYGGRWILAIGRLAARTGSNGNSI